MSGKPDYAAPSLARPQEAFIASEPHPRTTRGHIWLESYGFIADTDSPEIAKWLSAVLNAAVAAGPLPELPPEVKAVRSATLEYLADREP